MSPQPVQPLKFAISSVLSALLVAVFLPGCGGDRTANAETVRGNVRRATAVNGRRSVALLVGVGKYKNPGIRTLTGPANDVTMMYDLLTKQYDFPTENVTRLVDDKATTDAFRKAFDDLVLQVEKNGDIAVLYFAGHGSQVADRNEDEPDLWDDTLLFHDARTGKVKDLVDDELNAMLSRLHQRTRNIVVILDACSSATAMRDPSAGVLVARYEPPADGSTPPPAGPTGGARLPWVPAELTGAVLFAAASDGTSALESNHRGVFTSAVVSVFGKAGKVPLTYAQAARRVPPLVAAESYQVPHFEGDLDREVFGVTTRRRPVAWEVQRVGSELDLAGPLTPGMGVGAELRLYSPSLRPQDYSDPAKAKALLVVVSQTGLNASARIDAAPPNAAPPAEGDYAILIRPSDDSIRITVRLRPAGEPGGIPKERAAALRKSFANDQDAAVAVELTEGAGEFELSVGHDDRLVLRGPENNIRKTFDSSDDWAVPQICWSYARQKALRLIQPEGGSDFDEDTLLVRIVPAKKQKECGQKSMQKWVQSAYGKEQAVPLCVNWNIEVHVSEKAKKTVLVGGVVFSSDGTTTGFPRDGKKIPVSPGNSFTFKETFIGAPPLDTNDTVRVFATQETNPVEWFTLTSSAKTRGPKRGISTLHRMLDRYVTVGSRGAPLSENVPLEDTTWAAASIDTRVEANARFGESSADARPAQAREYTISDFDVRPYLPDDPESAMYRVLQKADELARTQVPYEQHEWKEGTDEENLERGIDCSRAIWYAFTRAGLPYNKKDEYLSTAQMVSSTSAMSDQFQRCDTDAFRAGDVIVYRDAKRGDGHVVMVIDPPRRIAWGSHGWDGNGRELEVEPQTGVEYQLIKYKEDWLRWDRKTMELQACWRYRTFAAEAESGKGLPGSNALGEKPEDACAPRRCQAARRIAD